MYCHSPLNSQFIVHLKRVDRLQPSFVQYEIFIFLLFVDQYSFYLYYSRSGLMWGYIQLCSKFNLGFEFKNHSLKILMDLMWCQESKQGQMFAKQVLYPLSKLSLWILIFKSIFTVLFQHFSFSEYYLWQVAIFSKVIGDLEYLNQRKWRPGFLYILITVFSSIT